MELGTGIFLSAVFLGIVALFIATKDRWNWKKILLWPSSVLLALAVIGGAGLYLNEKYESRPRKVTELWDISLTDTANDIKFKKGEPNERSKTDGLWMAYKPYETLDGSYVIYFEDGSQIRSIVYFGPMYNGPRIPSVGHYDSPEELNSKLGQPSFISRSKNELKRILSYDKYNIVAQFEAGKLSAVGIYNPEFGPMRYEEEASTESKSK